MNPQRLGTHTHWRSLEFGAAAQTQLRIALEIELDPESVGGIVRDGSSAETPSRGWLELLATLERLRAPASSNQDSVSWEER